MVEVESLIQSKVEYSERDVAEAKVVASSLTPEETRNTMRAVVETYQHDPNFPFNSIERFRQCLGNDAVWQEPEKHTSVLDEWKLEAALMIVNSPYAQVRAAVDNRDDVDTPCGTIRAYSIGILSVVVLTFINQLFSIRQPFIELHANVAQLLAYPLGKACAQWFPDKGFKFRGIRYSLNPGPFSKKEHMLITIMANVGASSTYTSMLIWVQYLPSFYNQTYAGQFGYQILITLSMNLIGYGLTGLIRRFLVYPAHCLWPLSLVTVALNDALHNHENSPVVAPFRRVLTASRFKFFNFWLPNYLVMALSVFSWITWIAPTNVTLTAISGFNNGLGFNPLPTFDWNILLWDPLQVPFFTTLNVFVGTFVSGLIILALWFTNTFNTAYLPINSPRVFDNTGNYYNVSRAIDDRGLFDAEKFAEYSPPYMSAGKVVVYLFNFANYPAVICHAWLNHRQEIAMGFKDMWRSFRKQDAAQSFRHQDIHMKLMSKYREVPNWWYLCLLALSVGLGVAGIQAFPTNTPVETMFYGIALSVVFVIPVGIVTAMAGVEVRLDVLAEFIGGSVMPGNALAMNYFKGFGFIVCHHAISFAKDLKLGHYLKIPPRHTFIAQTMGSIIATFVCTAVLNFQLHIPKVCTPEAPTRFYCPLVNVFFTASVVGGTVGPIKMFGPSGIYTPLLVGLPMGLVISIAVYHAQKRLHKSWMRQIHPIALMEGAVLWAPFNMSYVWPILPIAWISWIWTKKYYPALWQKYNFVLSAAFGCGIAFAAVIIFFALQFRDTQFPWAGNTITLRGCEGQQPCARLRVKAGEHFN
ncbi:OPT oligopeptide transporter protein-domain-containing protein [Xylariaceae sp. FL1272]|nr:OPT oligopeptide transporter protein-domain-containing protein [Xylariaceae sp. FL1272]